MVEMVRGRPFAVRGSREVFSIPSILAVIAAVLSFVVSAGWGLFLALAAVVLGVLGFVLALSPRVRGGVVSVVSAIAGGIGVMGALLRLFLPG